MDDPEERFTDLYDRHYRNVLGYTLLRAERDVAEDVASETFIVAWRRLSDVPEAALPWLLGVARNLLAKQRDSRHRRQALVDRIVALSSQRDMETWDVAEHVIDREQALAALSALREKDVEAMVFATWYGLTPEEAAMAMGCSVRTYNVRLHRARKRLDQALRVETTFARAVPQGRPARRIA
ncbi:RNA polymerase sigma factor [Spongiactinospora rosea]|uniref:RNA polymerase sigma factor n=1 Tax=Spongiactinospora rosea TaxID=2248750 RepID=UPI001314285D|nr:sigma-70 family RNA polymerase sigma factor [Spongiactinospora rosea]